MRNKNGSPAPPRRSIAYQVLRKAYSSGPLSHSEYAASLSIRRYIGVVFKAIVLLIALAMLLPLAYLLYRAAGVGWTQAVDLLARMRTVRIMWNSLILVCGVTTLSLALALPFAWLTERTDLPGWRIWTVLAMMPLVIPSYVGGFALIAMFGPRGALQELLSPFGVNRLPSIYGFTGALWVLTLFTYPYIFMSIRAALHRFDPSIEEAARSLGI